MATKFTVLAVAGGLLIALGAAGPRSPKSRAA